MRANNTQLKDRRSLVLDDFKGVDFSSLPFKVKSNRASNMENFINEYGVNKKRNGWKELFHIRHNDKDMQINGVFWYVGKERKEMLVHAGTRFYRVRNGESSYVIEDITGGITTITDTRSQAFFSKGKCYIVGCGDYLVYGSWNGGSTYELRRVADNEDTYVPTTTISIDDDSNETDIRATLEDVNLLSSKRKNQMLGRAFKEGESSLTWTVDAGKIDADTDIIISLDVMESGKAVTYTIENNTSDKTKLYKTHKDGESIAAAECGSVNFATGQITLTAPCAPPIEGRDNITVTFECAVEGYIDRIKNCTFGILFGVNGNTDRLFLSGNADFRNVNFYSEVEDFTYFSDMNDTIIGSDSSAIVGFARLSDSTLAVYKDEDSQDANIFYLNGTYETETDELGNPELTAKFSRHVGNIGESVVSRYACANFGGDNLILSRNGVFGIMLAENVATTERFTRVRSRSINEKLKTHADLSEAVGVVYGSRYYLAIDDVCFVADSKFKYVDTEGSDGSYNYEWWYWTNIPARVWSVNENELYFGCADGRVCVFDNEYSDRTYGYCQSGDLAIDTPNNRIIRNRNIGVELMEGESIVFYTDGIYSLLIDNATVANNRICVTEEQISTQDGYAALFEGMEVYADNVGESGLQVAKPYYIYSVDRGDCTFRLVDINGVVQTLTAGGFNLHRHISHKELYVTNVTDVSFQLKEHKDGVVLDLTSYNNTIPSEPLATVEYKANVVAKWYTPYFDFGTNLAAKTISRLGISTEQTTNGKLQFGYETRNVGDLIAAKGVNVFSFDDFSFENFTFDTGFANSYTVKVNIRNFNYIIFRFVSDNEFNCTINDFTIEYKFNRKNKGVQ